MKRTISSVLVLGMIAALLSIFAGVASATNDQGKGTIVAVNGMDATVSVTATDGTNTVDLGQNLGMGAIGIPAVVDPGDYTVTFNDGSSDVASYKLTVDPVSAWSIVSGYGDPGDSNASGASAYPVNLDEATPAIVFANSSGVGVNVAPAPGDIPQGKAGAVVKPGPYSITPATGTAIDVDLSGVPDTSYTQVFALGADATFTQATLTIADLAALKASLAPATPPSQIAVPDVVGQAEADANTAITDAGLVAARSEAADDTVPAGNVISQDPAAGTMVDAGATVNIVVSTGPDAPATVKVPDVAGKTADEGQQALEAEGFVVDRQDKPSTDVEAGLVIETAPAAGTEAAAGDTVTMYVSTGAEGVVVPNLVGLSQDEATKAAEAVGLTVAFVEDAKNPDPDGIVVSQDPAAGTAVDAGSEVKAQLSPKVDDAWVIVTLSPERVLTVAGINFQPGSTVTITVTDSGKQVTATVQTDGSWTASADLSNVDNAEGTLLIEGIAADGSTYSETFKVPAAGESTTEPTDEVVAESSGMPVWGWILIALAVAGLIALGIKMFGGGSSDGGTTGGTDTPPAGDTN
jgi:beta-lactam-binding protein with PASTA domain